MNDVMSVYRKNGGGMSFTDGKQDAEFLFNRIGMYKGIDQELDYRFHTRVRKNIARYYLMLANSIQYGNNPILSRYYALKSLVLSRPNKPEHLKKVIMSYVIPHSIMGIYANVKWQLMKIVGKAN
jgi:hypothetical protein